MAYCVLALGVLLIVIGLLMLFFSAFPFFFPFLLGSLVFLCLFTLGVFVLGWALLFALPVALFGLLTWTLLWVFL
ncbi:MAG: hypothetical protein N2205_00340 [Candidatus Caldatribacterium sp.]|uniref:hypothetical protein n=1 Tax=Candidatus Caldatribacterium sp. TaxID=2282143 RepID=UPI00299C9B96|nr:hypothetical protein [Candidatus Caldatribacterium sp.]MCX7729651.1 hypothetical protein [Candidatus Caldatribacterium sp.]MDW8081712.1 hypothetical protein [Candidatus Calescibacterium sp.]